MSPRVKRSSPSRNFGPGQLAKEARRGLDREGEGQRGHHPQGPTQAGAGQDASKLSRGTRHADYPLTGLILATLWRAHARNGQGRQKPGRQEGPADSLHLQHLRQFRPRSLRNTTCGHHIMEAEHAKVACPGVAGDIPRPRPRRTGLRRSRNNSEAQAKATSGDVERLEKRAADLDREVGRLVKAIRTVDAAEVVEELADRPHRRERVRAETGPGRQIHRFGRPRQPRRNG